MLDVRLFRNLRFSAASAAVAVSFFTLFGFIFLMTQYFQFIRGYSALTTGISLLPVALSVAIGSVAGTQLALRAGATLVVAAGLFTMTGLSGWGAGTTGSTPSYGLIAIQTVAYGLCLGLTSARPPNPSWMPSRGPRPEWPLRSMTNPAPRRHPGRRGDRQRVRLHVCRAPHVKPASGRAHGRRR